MRKFTLVIAALGALAWSSTAWAITGTTITVTNKQGQPLPGAEVSLQRVDKRPAPKPETAKTNDKGEVTLSHEEKDKDDNASIIVIITTKDGKRQTIRTTLKNVLTSGKITVSSSDAETPRKPRTPSTQPASTSWTDPFGGGTYAVGGWTGGYPVLVFGGNIGGGWSRNTYSDFPTFDGNGAGGGVYGAARFYVLPNFFVGPEAGFMLLDINARNPDSAFGIVRTDAYLGGQAGVTVQGPGASKINLYTGLDADWSRITVGVEAANERMSKTLGGWSVHGGVELQPIPSIPNLWLGLDLRHSDVSGTIGDDPTHVRWNMLSLTLSTQF
jgi:hypothetical protein